jgi:hypothetical protein
MVWRQCREAPRLAKCPRRRENVVEGALREAGAHMAPPRPLPHPTPLAEGRCAQKRSYELREAST